MRQDMKGIRFALVGVLLLLMLWVKLEDMRKENTD
jgi:hypothetical protein